MKGEDGWKVKNGQTREEEENNGVGEHGESGEKERREKRRKEEKKGERNIRCRYVRKKKANAEDKEERRDGEE